MTGHKVTIIALGARETFAIAMFFEGVYNVQSSMKCTQHRSHARLFSAWYPNALADASAGRRADPVGESAGANAVSHACSRL